MSSASVPGAPGGPDAPGAGVCVAVRYQGREEPLELPAGWRLIGVGNPAPVAPLADLGAAVRRAVANPVGMAGLAAVCAGARRVAVLVDDQARPTPTGAVVAALLPELRAAGVPDAAITVVVAKGTHRWPTEAEVRLKVGPAAESCAVRVHDPDDEAGLVGVGTTSRGTPVWVNRVVAEADVSIGVGAVVAHYMAGYGGGPKLLLPGVSGRRSIIANHIRGALASAAQAQTEGNPLYQDMLEAAELARLTMKIDLVLDMDNRPVDVVAGSVRLGHQAAIAAYNRVFGYAVPEPADVTVTSGYPLEIELLQSCKAVLSADLTTRDGGAIVLLTAATNGAGPGFGEALTKRPSIPEVWDWVRHGHTTPTGGPMVARVIGVLQRKRVVVVTTGLGAAEVRAMGFEHAPTPAAALALVRESDPTASVLIFPAGAAVNPLRAAVLV